MDEIEVWLFIDLVHHINGNKNIFIGMSALCYDDIDNILYYYYRTTWWAQYMRN